MAHTIDKNGYVLIEDNPISKSGIFDYLGSDISEELEPNKVYKVLREEKELNNPETINSFKLTPWLPRHEMIGEGNTDAEEVGVRGVTGENVYFKNGTLYSNLKLFATDLKQSIKDGLKELSCGFGCTWTVESGVYEGQPYQAKQTEIRGNHLASVPVGRMGKKVAVAMDRATFALDNLNLKPNGDDMTLEEAQAKIKDLEKKLVAKGAQDMDDKDKAEDMDKDKAEDMDKDKAEDKKPEKGVNPFTDKDDKKKGGMDAAIAQLTSAVNKLGADVAKIQSSAVDANSVMKSLSERNELANKSAAIVGAFDHSNMNSQEVAEYALKKIGMACDSGAEIATLNGYLAAKAAPSFIVDNGNALDSASATQSDSLDKAGL